MDPRLEKLLGNPNLREEEIRKIIVTELTRRAKTRKIDWYKPRSGRQLDFHSSLARHRWAICGNRAGKTTAGCVELLWWLTGWHPYRSTPEPPVAGCVITHSSTMQRSTVQPVLEKYLPREMVAKIYYMQRGIWDYIKFTNGSVLDFKTLDMGREKFQGAKWHIVHFDEEPKEDIHTEVNRGLVDYGGSTIGTMSPIMGMTWTYDRIFRNPEIETFSWSMYDNPFLDKEFIRKYEESLTPEERLARIHGKYTAMAGLVYPEWDRKIHVIPSYSPEERDVIVVGVDTGRAFAAAFVAFRLDGTAIMFDEVYTEEEVTPFNISAIEQVKKRINLMPEAQYVDATSPFVRDFAQCGFLAQPARNDVQIGTNIVRRWLQYNKAKPTGLGQKVPNPRLYVTANCRRAMWELPRYQWAKFPMRSPLHGQLRPKVLKRDDHMCDAIRYAFTYIPEVNAKASVEPLKQGLTAADLLPRPEDIPDPFDTSFPRGMSQLG